MADHPFVEALLTGWGMLWKPLWALIFGYLISAGIQVLVSRQQMARVLGQRDLKKIGLASFFGFISSSCSFAALSASKSVLIKGAHPVNSIAFLIAYPYCAAISSRDDTFQNRLHVLAERRFLDSGPGAYLSPSEIAACG